MSLNINSQQLKDNDAPCLIDEDEDSEKQSVTHCFDSPVCNDKPSCVGCPLFKG